MSPPIQHGIMRALNTDMYSVVVALRPGLVCTTDPLARVVHHFTTSSIVELMDVAVAHPLTGLCIALCNLEISKCASGVNSLVGLSIFRMPSGIVVACMDMHRYGPHGFKQSDSSCCHMRIHMWYVMRCEFPLAVLQCIHNTLYNSPQFPENP